jgi:hypothetical protein
MANGKFIVCTAALANEANRSAEVCGDCRAPIVIDGARDAAATYICEACLPARLERDEPDEVEVEVGADAAPPKLEGDALFAAIAQCKEARSGNCGCRWCQHIEPLAVDIAKAIKAHPEADKLTRVYVLIRMLGEAAVAANSMFGLYHRDASFTASVVSRELHLVADREHIAQAEKMRPIIEQALKNAGIDVDEILRTELPPERAH